jgi:predicted TIM-barrel fold metal-dependent hydrolase
VSVRLDVHQHAWTASILDALVRRTALPFARARGDAYVLELAGEPPATVRLDGRERVETFAGDGIDRALIAISSPLGIEALPRADALALIDAHLDGVAALGDSFRAWGPLPLDGTVAADVDALLARGCVGVSLPAGALSPPSAIEPLLPVLARAAELNSPLFIHPGPGLEPAGPVLAEESWWLPLTRYVSQMHASWLTLETVGRRELASLRIVYAMLAGLAPLHAERLLARGGPGVDHASSFYDTSSYGATAIDAMARCVGRDRLLYGSDRPVVEPPPHAGAGPLRENAAWLAEM